MRALALLLALAPAPALADAAQLADWWSGNYDNRAQVAANSAAGEPDVPELTRTARRMTIERVTAPKLGAVVVLLHEYKAPDMGVANRARVYVLKDLPDGRVRAVQHFFKDGPTYDRKPTDAAAVAAMTPGDFNFYPGCDLFFTLDAKTGRYAGGMPSRTCVYEHATDGFVYAEFDQFIWPRATWYRDRSVRIASGTVRGSIDGFSYLRFGKID
jgi:CpeT/CpcT family (DUF1001)